MDINTQNSSGMMNGMPPTSHTEKKVGPIVGALIIVLVLIIAALYFFGQKLNTKMAPQDAQTTEQSTSDIPADDMTSAVIQADDIASIEADLGAELQDVDYSF